MRGLQMLVAAACVAIIAFVGYFFYSERQDAKRQEVRAAVERHERLMRDIERAYGRRPQ